MLLGTFSKSICGISMTLSMYMRTYMYGMNTGVLHKSYVFHSAANDFDTDIIPVRLGPSAEQRGDTVSVPVPIIDDEINEETETYVGYIRLVSAVDPENVIFGISATQLIINDNDGKCVCV